VPVDVGQFWRTLGQRATGATVVTAQGDAGPAGFLGLSTTHIQAAPPTLLVAVSRTTSALAAILSSGAFAVNFLPETAADVADAFAGKTGLKGADRFRSGDWTTLETGAPVFRSALGAFDCVLEETIERDAVVLVIGRAAAAFDDGSRTPLILFRGGIVRPRR
jgi:flavin reductase (DIM6/NTAB) family NADH-FMN oxidoreductase RutF